MVRYLHIRQVETWVKARLPIATIAVFEDDEGSWIGFSVCSLKDNFSKKIGRKIAIGRAKKKTLALAKVLVEENSLPPLLAICEHFIKPSHSAFNTLKNTHRRCCIDMPEAEHKRINKFLERNKK